MTFDHDALPTPGSNPTSTRTKVASMARADLRWFRAQVRNCPDSGLSGNVVIDSYIGESRDYCYTSVYGFGGLINWIRGKDNVCDSAIRGLWRAVKERVAHDARGQRLTASLMDYALPRAAGIPMIKFTSAPVPSAANPKGMKGCGEAGTVGALAAVANAVQDALWDHGVRQADMPFTPHKVWELLNDGSVAAE